MNATCLQHSTGISKINAGESGDASAYRQPPSNLFAVVAADLLNSIGESLRNKEFVSASHALLLCYPRRDGQHLTSSGRAGL